MARQVVALLLCAGLLAIVSGQRKKTPTSATLLMHDLQARVITMNGTSISSIVTLSSLANLAAGVWVLDIAVYDGDKFLLTDDTNRGRLISSDINASFVEFYDIPSYLGVSASLYTDQMEIDEDAGVLIFMQSTSVYSLSSYASGPYKVPFPLVENTTAVRLDPEDFLPQVNFVKASIALDKESRYVYYYRGDGIYRVSYENDDEGPQLLIPAYQVYSSHMRIYGRGKNKKLFWNTQFGLGIYDIGNDDLCSSFRSVKFPTYHQDLRQFVFYGNYLMYQIASGRVVFYDLDESVTYRLDYFSEFYNRFNYFIRIITAEYPPSESPGVSCVLDNPVSSFKNARANKLFLYPGEVDSSDGYKSFRPVTDENLPECATTQESADGHLILNFPFNDQNPTERIGAFECIYQGSYVNSSTVAIVSGRGKFVPKDKTTITANVGESVTLVGLTKASPRAVIRWRHNGELQREWYREPRVLIESVSLEDAGIYEVYSTEAKREAGFVGIYRLIVRGCPKDTCNYPECDVYCDACENGGIADEFTSECICPPGFAGDYCEDFVGAEVFGPEGRFSCSSFNRPNREDCMGFLFCLPDPIGCLCGPGWYGIRCDKRCKAGFYGAGCENECKCEEDCQCDRFSGECIPSAK